jgi:aromatic-L-amino-acid decarboxylase
MSSELQAPSNAMSNATSNAVASDAAETGDLRALLSQIGAGLDEYLKFEHPDAQHPGRRWHEHLDISLPRQGIGIGGVVDQLVGQVIPNGSAMPKPGFSSFITTGGVTASTLASTAASHGNGSP